MTSRAADDPSPSALVPSADELFCDAAIERLRHSPGLSSQVRELRIREGEVTRRTASLSPVEQRRACLSLAVDDLRAVGIDLTGAALATPEDLLQAVRAVPFAPSTSVVRRHARELARMAALMDEGTLHVPASPGELRATWDQAMRGEPRLGAGYPSSTFRKGGMLLRGPLPEHEVLQECMDAREVPPWVGRLVALLGDVSLPPELRASCGLCMLAWIHPFVDGNGHTGRLLAVSALGDGYSPLTRGLFARELVMRSRVRMRLFGRMWRREADARDFCLGLLGQLADAQDAAREALGQMDTAGAALPAWQ